MLNASKMDRIFFTNSGTEAIEGAIKAAKKYAFTRDGHAGHEIIAMNHSFHGRSIGALSVTGNAHYQEPFEPLMPGVKFADFNDLESVKAQVTDKTCAIIMETIQGEGGMTLIGKIFETEKEIDAQEREIENLCMKLLLHEHPVAGDLRSISAALKMISDMERIGDQAADIADLSEHIEDN